MTAHKRKQVRHITPRDYDPLQIAVTWRTLAAKYPTDSETHRRLLRLADGLERSIDAQEIIRQRAGEQTT